jgi:hypothetical protein
VDVIRRLLSDDDLICVQFLEPSTEWLIQDAPPSADVLILPAGRPEALLMKPAQAARWLPSDELAVDCQYAEPQADWSVQVAPPLIEI